MVNVRSLCTCTSKLVLLLSLTNSVLSTAQANVQPPAVTTAEANEGKQSSAESKQREYELAEARRIGGIVGRECGHYVGGTIGAYAGFVIAKKPGVKIGWGVGAQVGEEVGESAGAYAAESAVKQVHNLGTTVSELGDNLCNAAKRWTNSTRSLLPTW